MRRGKLNAFGIVHRFCVSYPVDDQDLADAEFVLKLLGGDGHGVEVAETPVREEEWLKQSCIKTKSSNQKHFYFI